MMTEKSGSSDYFREMEYDHESTQDYDPESEQTQDSFEEIIEIIYDPDDLNENSEELKTCYICKLKFPEDHYSECYICSKVICYFCFTNNNIYGNEKMYSDYSGEFICSSECDFILKRLVFFHYNYLNLFYLYCLFTTLLTHLYTYIYIYNVLERKKREIRRRIGTQGFTGLEHRTIYVKDQ